MIACWPRTVGVDQALRGSLHLLLQPSLTFPYPVKISGIVFLEIQDLVIALRHEQVKVFLRGWICGHNLEDLLRLHSVQCQLGF